MTPARSEVMVQMQFFGWIRAASCPRRAAASSNLRLGRNPAVLALRIPILMVDRYPGRLSENSLQNRL
jgi:hypothetical protein